MDENEFFYNHNFSSIQKIICSNEISFLYLTVKVLDDLINYRLFEIDSFKYDISRSCNSGFNIYKNATINYYNKIDVLKCKIKNYEKIKSAIESINLIRTI